MNKKLSSRFTFMKCFEKGLRCLPFRPMSVVITLVFIVVELTLVWSLTSYWEQVLQPRLRLAAETHAQVLANSHAVILKDALLHGETADKRTNLELAITEILLVTDPSIHKPFVKQLSLSLDYDIFVAPVGSLDIDEGESGCTECFLADIPLINQQDQIFGIASFTISDAYYQLLSADMKLKLFGQSSIAMILLLGVWLMTLLLFSSLYKAKKLIESSDRAKTRFMANVSHELRTPLNAILGYTQLYKKDQELMQHYRQGIETIDRSADHLLLMINDILDFSKVESESLQLLPREVNLTHFLDTLVEMTDIRARLKDIRFIREFDPNLPCAVLIDDKRLRQVLLNLLNNAVKFTAQGSVTLRIVQTRIHRKVDFTQSQLLFEVLDTGPGIPEQELTEIFLPFQQVQGNQHTAEGAGLGLAISKNLLELMNADLCVDSRVGVGSRFYFSLMVPILHTDLALEPLETDRIIGIEGVKKRILVIDDNLFNRDVIRQRLEQIGFDVIEAADGEEGIRNATDDQPDLILLDLRMPNMDGFTVVKHLRKVYPLEQMPILALTAAINTDTWQRVKASGFDDLIAKPVDDHQLLTKLQQYLNLQWRYESVDTQPQVNDEQFMVPDHRLLQAMYQAASKHNVLALRDLLSDLECQPDYHQFTEMAAQLIKSYQFKKLVLWLNDYIETEGT